MLVLINFLIFEWSDSSVLYWEQLKDKDELFCFFELLSWKKGKES